MVSMLGFAVNGLKIKLLTEYLKNQKIYRLRAVYRYYYRNSSQNGGRRVIVSSDKASVGRAGLGTPIDIEIGF